MGGFYIGFDPSADSLTIGNLLAMSLIIRGARAGLDAVVLFGGGTGLIGDPSGKSVERSLLPIEEARKNVARHRELMTAIFERALTPDQTTSAGPCDARRTRSPVRCCCEPTAPSSARPRREPSGSRRIGPRRTSCTSS